MRCEANYVVFDVCYRLFFLVDFMFFSCSCAHLSSNWTSNASHWVAYLSPTVTFKYENVCYIAIDPIMFIQWV